MNQSMKSRFYHQHLQWFTTIGTVFLFLFLFLADISNSHALIDNNNQFIEYLTQQKMELTKNISAALHSPTPIDDNHYLQLQKENQALITLNKANLASLESFLSNQQVIKSDFSERIKQLEHSDREKSSPLQAQQRIDKINKLNNIHKKIITLIEDNLDLTKRYQQILLDNQHRLKLWNARQILLQQLAQSHVKQEQLGKFLNSLYAKNINLQQEMKGRTDFNATYLLDAQLLLNNQLINFTQYKITELGLQRKLARTDYSLLKSPNIRTLQIIGSVYQEGIDKLSQMQEALKNIVSLLKEESRYLSDPSLKGEFFKLENTINKKITDLTLQQKTLQADLAVHQVALKKQLAVRQSLSEYRVDTWSLLLLQMSDIPGQLYQYGKSLFLKLKDNYQWLDFWPEILLWLLIASLTTATFFLVQKLKKMTRDSTRSRLSAYIYDVFLIVLLKNVPLLSVALSILILFYFNHVLFVNYQLLLNLFFVALTFRSLILIARIVLLDRVSSDNSGHDVNLYFRIKWLLLVGAWTTALMVLSHLLPLSLLLQDLFNRFFMLFLVAVSVVFWRSRELITHLLHPLLKNKKAYLKRAVMMLVVLIPITLFTTAIIGLVGYINLAWTMSSYQIELLLLLAFYVLCRGLMFDALELISEWMVSSLSHGWLWLEVFLKPLDKIMRLLLLVLAFYILFLLFGWDSKSWVVTNLVQFYHYPFVNLSGIRITPKNVLEFFALLFLLIWLSKWTREFCYRWLYKSSPDHGVRNSLAVFTQYGVILIGALIALRVLGFELSNMSIILGGLAVGMGFGLRDFASNIVGGLMLLIERPVREGDLITIDNYEGKVTHIGIRSMRVCSWDNMEVLIPNAETFNKPFTNWTHQDSIVRTVITMKVSRLDDPVLVQQLVLDVLGIIPEILKDPLPQVFLMQISEALIEFEVRYFINVSTHSRVETRSKVLFAIMAQFKAAGIKSPIPPLEVDLKDYGSDLSQPKQLPQT